MERSGRFPSLTLERRLCHDRRGAHWRFVTRRDERAFRQLYVLHTPAVYGFIRRLVGRDVALADDVLQEAWLRASSGLAFFRGESAFRTWLTGIALNCYREWRLWLTGDRPGHGS